MPTAQKSEYVSSSPESVECLNDQLMDTRVRVGPAHQADLDRLAAGELRCFTKLVAGLEVWNAHERGQPGWRRKFNKIVAQI